MGFLQLLFCPNLQWGLLFAMGFLHSGFLHLGFLHLGFLHLLFWCHFAAGSQFAFGVLLLGVFAVAFLVLICSRVSRLQRGFAFGVFAFGGFAFEVLHSGFCILQQGLVFAFGVFAFAVFAFGVLHLRFCSWGFFIWGFCICCSGPDLQRGFCIWGFCI